jgi:glycosyltransferase involved in cell wall biosynthesis
MKIAIDLTAIPSNLTGIGIYTENLVQNIGKIDKSNNYYIFIKKENSGRFFLRQPNFKFIIILNYPKMIRLLWEQFVLPFYLLFFKIDLLHSPHYTIPLLAFWIKRIATFPDMTFLLFPDKHEKYKVLFFRWMLKKSARFADRIISISFSTSKDIAKSLSIKPDKIKTTQLSASDNFRPIIDKEEIKSRLKNRGLPQKYILFVGTIEPRKNVNGLIEAYLDLNDKIRSEYKLVIVGQKGWHYNDLFARITREESNTDIIFAGYVEDEFLPFIYNGAAVFVYPSFYEGFGLPVLEAMACGTPTITSNISSMPEIAGEAALLIDPNNILSIKSAIERLWGDKGLQDKLRIAGIGQAKKFSWWKCAKETLDVFEKTYSC